MARKMQALLHGGGVSLRWKAWRLVGYPTRPCLFYVIPGAGWVTDWIGQYIAHEMKQQFQWHAYATTAPHLLTGQIVHFGEVGAFLTSHNKAYTQRNQLICTFFHGNREPQFPELTENVDTFLAYQHQLTKVVTACSLMVSRLQAWGVPPEKITFLPLGIELNRFQPAQPSTIASQRQQFGIPKDAFCIGSFQKDGVGWGEGDVPKMVKGPDIFLEVIAQLYARYPNLFVLLTGPSRGYVKKGLDKIGVPYQHHFVEDYRAIISMYHLLDAYLISSREEGGPKAVLESLATAVPLVSTRVGMTIDVIQHEVNGLLADVDDVSSLTEQMNHLIESPELRSYLTSNGLQTVQAYDWPLIAAQYYHELYEPLLREPHQ